MAWTGEKTSLLNQDDYGSDEDAANKLLNRHKATLVELDTYKDLITNLRNQAETLVRLNHPDIPEVEAKQVGSLIVTDTIR